MASTLKNLKQFKTNKKGNKMSTKDDKSLVDDTYINPDEDDWGFVGGMDETVVVDERQLPDNSAVSALNCGFVGIGGGGGKLAKAFLDLGFNKTLLVNTTDKDQPAGIDPQHFMQIPGTDGVGKDVALGKKVLSDNSAMVEDALRSRLGKVDWVFLLAGGGGGTGSACHALHGACERYLKSIESGGGVVYIITKPSAQELLNPALEENYSSLLNDVKNHPYIIIDNERQLQLLRGKVGMLDMYPAANGMFAKSLHQVLKLAASSSEISAFDSNDLERCLSVPGRIFLGTTVVKDPSGRDLGAGVFQGCLKGSACPSPTGKPATGVLLLIVTSAMASDPDISNRLEAASAYVGGRADILFTGIYVNDKIPGLIALTIFGGIKE
jgi:cell division GTPase FtsZ